MTPLETLCVAYIKAKDAYKPGKGRPTTACVKALDHFLAVKAELEDAIRKLIQGVDREDAQTPEEPVRGDPKSEEGRGAPERGAGDLGSRPGTTRSESLVQPGESAGDADV